jgi:hypothetical protein
LLFPAHAVSVPPNALLYFGANCLGIIVSQTSLAEIAEHVAFCREQAEQAQEQAYLYLRHFYADPDRWEDQALWAAAEADRCQRELADGEQWADDAFAWREHNFRSVLYRGRDHRAVAPRRGPRARGAGRPAVRRSRRTACRAGPDGDDGEPEPPRRRHLKHQPPLHCNTRRGWRMSTEPADRRRLALVPDPPRRYPLEPRFGWRVLLTERLEALGRSAHARHAVHDERQLSFEVAA